MPTTVSSTNAMNSPSDATSRTTAGRTRPRWTPPETAATVGRSSGAGTAISAVPPAPTSSARRGPVQIARNRAHVPVIASPPLCRSADDTIFEVTG